ncbi:MAG: shikimate dehydrogenase [Elusimicrobia bacterium]|nr:shikimate dehydrogenase [Elusimicrobiota bacterium]
MPSSKAKKAAVLGWPAGKSRSPELYAKLSKLLKKPLDYERLAVPEHELPAFMDQLRKTGTDDGWVGVNVTIPHKEAVLRHLDSAKPEAKAIGAVNVVTVSRRQLVGDNTDAGGFLDALAERNIAVPGLEVLLFGAGGAARAVGWALGSLGAARVHMLNRNGTRAIELAGALSRLFQKTQFTAGPQWPRQAMLWVNATPLGMDGFPAESPIPAGFTFPRGATAYDLVYRPAKTPFLKQAEGAGANVIGGADMLLYQALRTWELWFEPLGGRRRRELKAELFSTLKWD